MEHHAASPTPAGLVAFAVACYTFTAVFAGLVPGEGLFLLGCWLLGGFAGVVKPIVAVCLAVAGSLGLYVASAIQLNSSFGRTVFPLGTPWLKSDKA